MTERLHHEENDPFQYGKSSFIDLIRENRQAMSNEASKPETTTMPGFTFIDKNGLPYKRHFDPLMFQNERGEPCAYLYPADPPHHNAMKPETATNSTKRNPHDQA